MGKNICQKVLKNYLKVMFFHVNIILQTQDAYPHVLMGNSFLKILMKKGSREQKKLKHLQSLSSIWNDNLSFKTEFEGAGVYSTFWI